MSLQFPAETIEAHHCRVVLRRLEGAHAQEFFFHCRPLADTLDVSLQADAIYQAILKRLEAEGYGFDSVVRMYWEGRPYYLRGQVPPEMGDPERMVVSLNPRGAVGMSPPAPEPSSGP